MADQHADTPDASSSKNAAASGFPNSVLIAAKLPVAAMTAPVLAGLHVGDQLEVPVDQE